MQERKPQISGADRTCPCREQELALAVLATGAASKYSRLANFEEHQNAIYF